MQVNYAIRKEVEKHEQVLESNTVSCKIRKLSVPAQDVVGRYLEQRCRLLVHSLKRPDKHRLEQWIPGSAHPDHPLLADLIPETCWLSNLRSFLIQEEWSCCEQFAFTKSEFFCTVYRQGGKAAEIGCYEKWEFDAAS